MIKHPLVSIITPTYNQASFLSETIESVLAQDYPNIEYIVLDDGSTDSTPELLRSYNGRIHWERHENVGQVHTLNKGWSISKGEIIGYLSSDDILYPGAISKLVEVLLADDNIVCTFPNSDLIDSKSIVVKKNVCRPFDLIETIIRQECYIGPGALFRRCAYDAIGGWKPNLKLAPDREFWIRLSAHGRIEMCQSTLAGYRIHAHSISYKDVSEEVSREYLWVLDQYFIGEGVLAEVELRKSEAYGYAYLLLARNSFRSGHYKRGLELYYEACRHHDPLRNVLVKIRVLQNIISKPIRIILSSFQSIFRA